MDGKRISAVSFAVTIIALLLLFSMASVLSAMQNTVSNEPFVLFALEKTPQTKNNSGEAMKMTLFNKEILFDFTKANVASLLLARNDDFIPVSLRLIGYGARAITDAVCNEVTWWSDG